MKNSFLQVVVVCLILFPLSCPELKAQDFTCLNETQRAEASFYTHLQQQAYEALDRRTVDYEQLRTPEQIRAYQQRLKTFFVKQLGGFPDRTPLNSRTVRTIDADGYRIECIIFESQPDHHVTANLYLPDTPAPVPGVVVSSGHSRTAKTADYNQRFGIMMARQGMAALCFDPIGQGERSQFLNADGQPLYRGTTTEHFLVGVGSILTGRNTARYRIWDAMRAVDFLVSRPEVIDDRIGFTGCSGGGTLTSYVMALDDRVACAAPACYLTTMRHLIETVGPQDAEQNIFGQVAFGLDHPDYVLLRAPRPTLTSSTTGDYFSIQGAWENYRQAKRIYGRLGFPERVDLVEVEGNHGVHPQNLATIAHWMKRWLLDRDEPVQAVELPTLPPDQLHCTETGQVLTSFKHEKSVIDLNSDFEDALKAKRVSVQQELSDDELRAKICEHIGIETPLKIAPPTFEDLGRIPHEGFHVDKLTLMANSRILPGLTFHPPTPEDAAYLFLHETGKPRSLPDDGPVIEILRQNYAVVAIDLSGQGETGLEKQDPVLTDWKTYYLSYLLGQSLIGTRTEDALAAADFVAYYQKDRDSPRKVHLVAEGRAGIVALHAAALRPDLFASVTIRNTAESWGDIVRQKVPAGQLDSTVHGVLHTYDLPDLVRLIGADKVIRK